MLLYDLDWQHYMTCLYISFILIVVVVVVESFCIVSKVTISCIGLLSLCYSLIVLDTCLCACVLRKRVSWILLHYHKIESIFLKDYEISSFCRQAALTGKNYGCFAFPRICHRLMGECRIKTDVVLLHSKSIPHLKQALW